ncbi:MAG: hypothetical protein ABC585_05370 [Candidatus Methanosuratincola petrocarbonis]|nr:hypothetical protein [Candidatus Methanosuratincola sp.]
MISEEISMGYMCGCINGHTWWYFTDATPCPYCGTTEKNCTEYDRKDLVKYECEKSHKFWADYKVTMCPLCGTKNVTKKSA